MKIKETINRLKNKWDIKSDLDFILIMVVFSLAGLNVSFCRTPLFHLLGFTVETALWIKTVAYLLLIFPLYQLSLLFYGFLLGQFDFFWSKEKELVRVVARRFTKTRIASSKSEPL